VWDVDKAALRFTLEGHKDLVRSIAISPNEKLLASASRDGTLRLWDFPSGKKLAVMNEGTLGFQALAFHPDGKILATGGIDRNITLWDVARLLKQHPDQAGK
jgi:WD40 repeat protein